MEFTPEQLEKKGYTVLMSGSPFATVMCVQCPRCGNAVERFLLRYDENERIDGYDHPAYSECQCV